MSSQRETAVEAAWPILDKWVTKAIQDDRQGFGLGKVVTDRPADTLADGLLRNCDVQVCTETQAALQVSHVSRFDSSPVFWRVRSVFAAEQEALCLDVLRQVASGSELQQAAIESWVESVVRAEVGLVWRALALSPEPLAPDVGITIDEHDTVTISDGIYVEQRETHIHREQVTTDRPIDELTIQRCRDQLGSGGRKLWLLTSDDPGTFTDEAQKVLEKHVVSRLPNGMVGPGEVVVTSPGVLDVVLLRETTSSLMWDHSSGGGVDLILEQLLAVEVVQKLQAVTFTRSV